MAQCHPALYLDFVVSQVVESVTFRKEQGQQSPQQKEGFLWGAHLIHSRCVFNRWVLQRPEDELPRVIL